MALGVKMLGMLPGLRRPALLSRMPGARGDTCLLDLGAVVCGQGTGQSPGIGLLHVGHEDSKGHSVVKQAHERLRTLPLNYRGFIEGDQLFAGEVDVAFCDGFSGNLLLKSSEGLARMFFGELRHSLDRTLASKFGAWLARPAVRGMLARFDPAQHNGAPLLGLNGVVIKSHGSAGKFATMQAILEAGDEAGRHISGKIQELIQTDKAES